MKLIVSVIVAVLAISLPAHAEGYEKVFGAKSGMLENGMQVVVVENHRAPVVTHMVWYKVGSADEPKGDGVSGAAHFLEHLMFKGTKAIAPGDFSKLVRSIGGEDNAFTSWDYTAFFQSVPSRYLPNMMAFEADRMLNLTLDEKDITSERDVIIEERRMRTDNDPQTLFMEQLRAELFVNSPYAEPIIGWHDEMPLLSRQNVFDYYNAWYTPSNAILVISGDVTFEQAMVLAKKYYGYIPSRPTPDHVRPKVPHMVAPNDLVFESPEIQQPELMRVWVAPSYMDDRKIYDGLTVLCESLSGGSATKLYQRLVVDRKVASAVSLSYDGDSRGQGSLWLSVTPAPSVNMETIKTEVERAFREIVGNGITDKEVEEAKIRLIDSALYARDSVAGPAMVIGQSLAMGATLDDVENTPNRIASVTREDVQKLFDTYLNPLKPDYQPVTGIMLPKKESQE